MAGLQDSNSLLSFLLVVFHDLGIEVQIFALFLALFSAVVLFSLKLFRPFWLYTWSGPLVEFFWTIVPFGVLLWLSIPSLAALYASDDVGFGSSHLNTVAFEGHQWFWLCSQIVTDSYCSLYSLISSLGLFNLEQTLESEHFIFNTDQAVLLRAGEVSVFCSTSADVIHSISFPQLGVKVDSVPGKGNIALVGVLPGLYFGQCSELCGANHSHMPLCLASL